MKASGNYTRKASSPQTKRAGAPPNGKDSSGHWANKDSAAGMHSGTGTASQGSTHAGSVHAGNDSATQRWSDAAGCESCSE